MLYHFHPLIVKHQPSTFSYMLCNTPLEGVTFQGPVVQSWVKIPRVSARLEFRFESLKRISVLILFVYKLMIGSSKNSTENCPRKCFQTQLKKTRVKFNPELSANRLSNNWAKKYLGVYITNSLNWTKQAVEVKKKANKILGVLQRNLMSCSAVVNERAYLSMS